MELLDRVVQKTILRQLSEIYPDSADLRKGFPGMPDRQLIYNMAYLEGHGLLEAKWWNALDTGRGLHAAKITPAGIDFISDDGGLSAVLGVLTVRLHEDTIKALLIDQISKASGEETVKGEIIAKIKQMPAEALGTLTQRLLEAGLERVPDLLGALQKWLGP